MTVPNMVGHNVDHFRLRRSQSVDRGVLYVAPDGSDGSAGRSWTLPKATIAGAQAAAGNKPARIFVAAGDYDINETITLADGQEIEGVSTHGSRGTRLRATSSLSTNPMFYHGGSQYLTSGGLFNMHLYGTNDSNGGVGIYWEGTQGTAEDWHMDRIRITEFTSHGFHNAVTGGPFNPIIIGKMKCNRNGAGGTGDGLYFEGGANGGLLNAVHLAGDNNADSLLHIASINRSSAMWIGTMHSERTIDGRHDNIIQIDAITGNQANMILGILRVYANVSGGTDGNAFINVDDDGFGFSLGRSTFQNSGSNVYTYGLNTLSYSIAEGDFSYRRWEWNEHGDGIEMFKPGTYTPTNVSTDRSYDANSTTLDEVADVLGTLIADLQTLGLVG